MADKLSDSLNKIVNSFRETREKQEKENREEVNEILDNAVSQSGKDSPNASMASQKHKEGESAQDTESALQSNDIDTSQIEEAEKAVDKNKQKDLQQEAQSDKSQTRSQGNDQQQEKDSGIEMD